MLHTSFSILITTKNRLHDLAFTLNKIQSLLQETVVECVVFDDGCTDGTFEYVRENFPNIKLQRNVVSKGYLFCRNKMLNETKADFAISLDDEAHFLTENPLEIIEDYFKQNTNCGVVGFRIFWSKNNASSTQTSDTPIQVRNFVGCGHAWKMEAWKEVPDYPSWFVFYGEEDFASYQLFKKNIEIHYLPSVLVHHRVEVVQRKNKPDYQLRLRRSFRSGWYLYFLFYPISVVPKKLLYTLWIQIKTKMAKGDWQATKAIVQAVFDVIFNFPKLLKQSNRLSMEEYNAMLKLPPTKIYWKPEDEK